MNGNMTSDFHVVRGVIYKLSVRVIGNVERTDLVVQCNDGRLLCFDVSTHLPVWEGGAVTCFLDGLTSGLLVIVNEQTGQYVQTMRPQRHRLMWYAGLLFSPAVILGVLVIWFISLTGFLICAFQIRGHDLFAMFCVSFVEALFGVGCLLSYYAIFFRRRIKSNNGFNRVVRRYLAQLHDDQNSGLAPDATNNVRDPQICGYD